jgi:hypothetical protein
MVSPVSRAEGGSGPRLPRLRSMAQRSTRVDRLCPITSLESNQRDRKSGPPTKESAQVLQIHHALRRRQGAPLYCVMLVRVSGPSRKAKSRQSPDWKLDERPLALVDRPALAPPNYLESRLRSSLHQRLQSANAAACGPAIACHPFRRRIFGHLGAALLRFGSIGGSYFENSTDLERIASLGGRRPPNVNNDALNYA